MKVSDIYKNGGRTLSFEIFPPKRNEELRNIDATLEVLCELKPDHISVTFGAGGSSNCNKTIELARKIKEQYGVEPVVHLTCLYYDREEIDAFADVLRDAGIENILQLLRIDYVRRLSYAKDLKGWKKNGIRISLNITF